MTKRRAAGEGAAPAPASTPSPRTEEAGDADEEETPTHFWIEPDAGSLDCAICLMPFEAEIYMCTNGHAACAPCCLRINRKCWCCGEPIGDVRCRPLEDLLADMSTQCTFRKFGCCESVRYTERRAHEEACPRAPYGCPLGGGCSYRGLLLYQHLVDDHADAVSHLRTTGGSTKVTVRKREPFRVLVQPGTSRVYLLLNGGDVLGGRSLSLVCLGPRPQGDGVEISYKMEVRGGEPGALAVKGTAPCVRNLEGFQAKKFVFVPDADWGSSGTVTVSVRVC
ncbi:hypothetical protein EJB05_56067 [Eragrostis curvula]|uniref:SIAH-type domain-containing protein n=1 Tax=Eragrostis curvula TaxID=38414 RepID=A0A5J9SI78_9POAL|nr:hypothetical protein EJB05_56067 [Eragrostis curvula]